MYTNEFADPEPPLFVRPAHLDDALEALSLGARVFAGGTDLMPGAGEAEIVGDFVDVSRLPGLRGVTGNGAEIRIGGATTWSEIARAELPPGFAALQTAASEIGALQIKNRGTIAGNLCNASPAADGVPPLLALDAEVELISLRGARRLPLTHFLQGPRRTAREPDEILSAVICPRPPATTRAAFLKLGARRYLIISIVMVAVSLKIELARVASARVAVGACSAVAIRLEAAERRLQGARAEAGLGEILQPEDFATLSPIDDLRATADYRRAAALILTRRAVELCLQGERGGVV